MNKRIFILLVMLLVGTQLGAEPWGLLKKIYYYNALGQLDEVQAQFSAIDFQNLIGRKERETFAERMIELGLYYQKKGNYPMAEIFFYQAMKITPSSWPAWNGIASMDRENGNLLGLLKNGLSQFKAVFQDFYASILILGVFAEAVFFSVLLLLFIWAFFIFNKYFRLAGHDFITFKNEILPSGKLVILAVLFIWPIMFFSGWGVFPFLILGVLWYYLADRERLLTYCMMIILLVASLLLSLVRSWEKEMVGPEYKTIRSLFAGEVLERSHWPKLDTETKELLAFSFYASGQIDEAVALLTQSAEHRSFEKFFILGNIALNNNSYQEAADYYQQALAYDNGHPEALNNLTMALLRYGDSNLLREKEERFPKIMEFKQKKLNRKELVPSQRIMIKRLLFYSAPRLNIFTLLGRTGREFLQTQSLFFLALFFIYSLLVPKFFFKHGRSLFCNKCEKIINQAAPAHSNLFCEECCQLFRLSDVVFLDAKLIKEKEIKKRRMLVMIKALLVSLLFPGYYLNLQDKPGLFFMTAAPFLFFFVFTVFSQRIFYAGYGISPVFIVPLIFLTVFLYLAGNLIFLREVSNGF